jgi:hypothetical protein
MRDSVPARPRRLKNGFPAEYRKLSPLAKLGWLKSDEARQMVTAGELQQNQLDSAAKKLTKDSKRISRKVPSPCRLEEFWEGYPFPPAADTTPMRIATVVMIPQEIDVLWPANYLNSEGVTYDVVADWIDSVERRMEMVRSRCPSAHALQRLEEIEIRSMPGTMTEKLEPEDEESLRAEIREHEIMAKRGLTQATAEVVPPALPK